MTNTFKSTLVAVAAAFAAAGAFAQEATPDTWTKIVTSADLQTVRADAVASHKAGNISYGEATRHGVVAPQLTPLSRAQVQAETREAIRLDLLQSGEGPARVATAQELESIRLAGLRASGSNLAQR